ncbi:DUF4440 domain-containing protein [Pseudomonas sp. RIT-PI-AD]|uniref:nuclear transport factor 2 family protein n=1 Tax=Pseudomonas sp. RIT-PI-AD TaxID=3035294 RepID=UPI0021DA44C1|nr:DUF4440 domain-containing protein [Pseudomonas sp. RIT-PI-AD]
MEHAGLLETLEALERALHQPDIRRDVARLERLLHPGFREFGRSGAAYGRDDALSLLPAEQERTPLWAQDFHVEPLGAEAALLTYRSAGIDRQGALDRHTNRSSLWRLTAQGWQLFFHQGTPCESFLPCSTLIVGRKG